MDLLGKMATYVRVVESGSLSAAAKQLRVSSAAVSRQLSTLERELDASLLTRTTRSMTVTTAGRRYYERCVRILREVDDAQTLGRDVGIEGPLRISASVTFGLACVVPQMQVMLAKHPGLTLELHLEDRIVQLVPDGFDVAIRVGSSPPLSNEIVGARLATFQRGLVASPRYLRKHGEPKRPEALARHVGLIGLLGGSDAWTLLRDDDEVRVRPQIAFRCNAFQALRELALAGTGVAFLPEWFVADDIKAKRLRPILRGWRSAPVSVHALYPREQRGAQRVRALIEELRDAFSVWTGPLT